MQIEQKIETKTLPGPSLESPINRWVSQPPFQVSPFYTKDQKLHISNSSLFGIIQRISERTWALLTGFFPQPIFGGTVASPPHAGEPALRQRKLEKKD